MTSTVSASFCSYHLIGRGDFQRPSLRKWCLSRKRCCANHVRSSASTTWSCVRVHVPRKGLHSAVRFRGRAASALCQSRRPPVACTSLSWCGAASRIEHQGSDAEGWTRASYGGPVNHCPNVLKRLAKSLQIINSTRGWFAHERRPTCRTISTTTGQR